MSALEIPESGLSLRRDDSGNDSMVRPTQIMRLNLAQNTLDELIQSLRNDQTAKVRLGKHPTLYYGSKSQSFHSCPETHRSEIYSGNSADKENLYFTGVLSHNLEVQKAKQATASTDQALANLEQSLNAFERGKESKKTHMIENLDDVKALRAKGPGRQAALLGHKPGKGLEKDRFLTVNANRSMSSSPALGAAQSPASRAPPTPTSALPSQNKDQLRLDALKVPFIHLLAIRSVSTQFLSRQTRASLEDCTTLAQKYGIPNRLDPDKFVLRDKAYRELDVWKFPYPSQEDRQEAIENAISAFDRLRLSRSDNLWQKLLPKEERGKGKCLSRLDLRTGPIKKPRTPQIQVQNPDEPGKDDDTTGHETDQASGNGRLTPNAGGASPAPKGSPNPQKKRAGEKDTGKRPAAKAKNVTNSTLTGRITKKAERKTTTVKPDGKFKSSEYVHDSDEDDTDMPGASAPEKPQSEKTTPQPKPAASKPKPSALRESSHVPTPKAEPPENPPAKVGSKRPPPSQASDQKSPQKTLPNGSPATNGPAVENRSRSSSQNNSSSSSSPLITQSTKTNKAPAAATAAKKPVKPNGAVKTTETANPLKRKAEMDRPQTTPSQIPGRTGDLEHKRRRAISSSSGSTGSASPPLSLGTLRQQLQEKSQKFKQYYAKYRALHDAMAAHVDPPRADLEKLQRQHTRLQRMKKEIWEEDRRLRDKF